MIHLLNHENSPAAAVENRLAHLHADLRWQPAFAERIVERAARRGLITRHAQDSLTLTAQGRDLAQLAVTD